MYRFYFPNWCFEGKHQYNIKNSYTGKEKIMNTIEFLAGLCGQQKLDLKTMSASDFFDGPGIRLVDYIASKLEVEGLAFKITSCAIRDIENHPFYVGRSFMSDMEELGFKHMIIAYASENGSPILTYLFSMKD